VIERLVLFGATGDLAGRFLLPALAALRAAGRLPDGFEVVAAGREDLAGEAFRREAAGHLTEHCSEIPRRARDALLDSLRYRQADIGDSKSVAAVVRNAGDGPGDGAPVAVYLALPPGLFARSVSVLGDVGLPAGSRIALEKPFGEDLESAVALNELLAAVAGEAGERAVFRVDHVLGMPTVQNLVGLRIDNPVLKAVWSSTHIRQVEILWEETLALEDRAAYYDRAGALKDVMQNHVLQLLALAAMEPPGAPGEDEFRDRKLEALRSVRELRPTDAASWTRRARYTAGRLARDPDGGGRTVPAYADEDGVDPARGTETFAEVVLEVESERWAGTRFVLRAGKALARRRKGIVVHFRSGGAAATEMPEPTEILWIGIDGPDDIALSLTGRAAGPPARPHRLELIGAPPPSELPPYAHVLLDLLGGGNSLSVSGDEAEEAWRIVTPVLQAWADGVVPLLEYPAGSRGPEPVT
jgi:glucose-6-phosphate 1-dehydrogenase